MKAAWFRSYTDADRPATFVFVFQSLDTANKPSELSDFSAYTTWGVENNNLYLLNAYRKHIGYPELKRAVRDQAEVFNTKTILIEDGGSGTQLIQDLVNDGIYFGQKVRTDHGQNHASPFNNRHYRKWFRPHSEAGCLASRVSPRAGDLSERQTRRPGRFHIAGP